VPVAVLIAVGLLFALRPSQQETVRQPVARAATPSAPTPSIANLAIQGEFYVPTQSLMRVSAKDTIPLDATLNIHNASERKHLVLTRIDYFDTSGNLVERYLERAKRLAPFETFHIFIPMTDNRGGTGGNFVVAWAAEDAIAEPVVEAVMTGSRGTHGYSFVSIGRPIRVIGKNSIEQ
jgi:hypothetical protein